MEMNSRKVKNKTNRIPLEELAKLPSFYLPTLSWRRDKIAFYWDKTGRIELYVMDLQDRKPRQISHGEMPRSLRAGFVWDRDDQTIIFAKDREGDEQHDLFQIDVQSKKVEQLTDNPKCQEFPIQVSPDKEWLTVLTNKRSQLNLFKIKLDGSEYVQLTNHKNPVFVWPWSSGGGTWSPDGKFVAYNVNETPDLNNFDVYVVRSDGSELRHVLCVREGSQDRAADWSPDGYYLAVTSDASGVNQSGLLDLKSYEVRWLGEEGVDETAMKFSKNGQVLVCLRNQDSQIHPVLYNVQTGERRDLKMPPGIAWNLDFVNDDEGLIMLFTTPTRRAELVLYDLETDRYETLLPAEYGSIDPNVFVESEHIWYPSFDGLKIPALLFKPRKIPKGEKLPAIVIVHGGPTSQWFHGFEPYGQFLTDRGYVVLEPNIRGSTGYGVKFRNLNRFDWGGGDLEDVARGAEYLKSLPYVDPKRLAICGGSYGGYMTFMHVVKKPDLWKAASAWVGITDLKKNYDVSMEHFKYFFRIQMGDPEENARLWEERSAINFIDRLKAKLQIVHGVNDPRCMVEQSRIFRDRLLELDYQEGKDFEYIEFSDQGHGSIDIEHKIGWYKHLADFMDRVL
jgi:dipeptidyl aminopeptidase/acylaminoacyl peptidase